MDTNRYDATAISTTTIATIDIASSITRQRSDTDELVARSGENSADVGLRIRSVAIGITEGSPAARSRLRERCG
ncbi:hypothetical protein OKHIF_11290 [Mycobacteroides chelonae]